MASLNIQKNPQPVAQKPVLARSDAGLFDRMMRDMLAYDPFREMSPFFEQPASTFMPSFEVKETKDGYVFKADVPGIAEKDLAVSLTGNRLTISGKRDEEKKEEKDTYYTYERSYGSFTRSFTLPDGIAADSMKANLDSGVLTIDVKKVPEAQPKQIPVTAQKK